MALPKTKTTPTLDITNAKVLLYGPPKIGKSTLCAGLDPEHTLFLATEPGLGALEVFSVPVTSWEQFRTVGADLAKGKHDYRLIVVDTVDELYRLCSDQVLADLGVTHASDAAYGKGWAAVSDEFRLRVAKLASLGMGVWFVSHSVDRDIEGRVGRVTKTVPTIPNQARGFLVGFCDFIFLAAAITDVDGERRVLRTSATENYEAGGRVTLPDPLDLDGPTVADALAATLATIKETP